MGHPGLACSSCGRLLAEGFEPASVSFRQHETRRTKKVSDPIWQPKLLWTARRLAELSADVDTLRKKLRIAGIAAFNSPARKRKLPPNDASRWTSS
jgi:hypothetical protein